MICLTYVWGKDSDNYFVRAKGIKHPEHMDWFDTEEEAKSECERLNASPAIISGLREVNLI